MSIFLIPVFLHVLRCATLAVLVWGSQTMLIGLFKNASFGPPSNMHTCILLAGILLIWTVLGLNILAHFNFLISPVFFQA